MEVLQLIEVVVVENDVDTDDFLDDVDGFTGDGADGDVVDGEDGYGLSTVDLVGELGLREVVVEGAKTGVAVEDFCDVEGGGNRGGSGEEEEEEKGGVAWRSHALLYFEGFSPLAREKLEL